MFTVMNNATAAIDAMAESVKVTRRSFMKPILVLSGTKRSGVRGSSFGRRRRTQSATIQRVSV